LKGQGKTPKGAKRQTSISKVKKAWPASSSNEPLETALNQTCETILEGQDADDISLDMEELQAQARLLSIRLEFVAGLQSPAEDQDQRMQYQVDRLAESMSGDSTRQPALEEARDAEIIWLGMYALPEPDFKAFGKRIKQALSAIMES